MPVSIFPYFPPERTELVNLIKNKSTGEPLNGEIDIYIEIHEALSRSEEQYYVWHDLNIPFHVNGKTDDGKKINPKKKSSTEIDFLILCKKGVLVLEVKGTSVYCKNRQWYYANGKDCQDPFAQAIGQFHTVRNKILNGIGAFHTYGVALPHVNKKLQNWTFDDFRLWSNYNKYEKGFNNIEDLFNRIFQREFEKQQKKGRNYKFLNNSELIRAKERLNDVLDKDVSPFVNIADTESWLQVKSLETYKALEKNQKLMIQGPPGSGKTTYAKAYIDQNKSKKGLYFCWNKLLQLKVQDEINKRDNSVTQEFSTVFSYILENAGMSYEKLEALNELEFTNHVRENLPELDEDSKYDFLILDELQDYVDRGVDIIIDRILKGGLKNGRLLTLYDIDQSYTWSGRNILDDIEFISDYCAHVKLDEIKRSNQSPEIQNLVKQIGKFGTEFINDLKEINAENIKILESNLDSCLDSFCDNYLNLIRSEESSLLGKDCMILIESKLYDKKSEFNMVKTRELNSQTITIPSPDVGYTKIPTFKGLEVNNVFLFITPPDSYNIYEWYLGVSRAMKNLIIYIVSEY
tara:strand:- start:9167 stop:10894 length:1728 start_codon:yes stop_codon:yes gene_type:complete